uniref:Small ribosomal subunit protein uS10m n=1 Tax=Phallusia mammillata TaxID=59560 RepID=A0A6F9DLC8_9ASCI|nr:28S ribosomal protein S10, mitochondrial-like [Phallusia mammillata]
MNLNSLSRICRVVGKCRAITVIPVKPFSHTCMEKTLKQSEIVSSKKHFKDIIVLKSSLSSHDELIVDEKEKLYKAIDIFVKSHEEAVLDSYIQFCSSAAEQLDIPVHRVLTPKFIIDRMTLLKSKHIFKKHRVQYEIRTHKKVLQLKRLTGSTAQVYLEYIQRNLPAGVAMHVHKWELERIPAHIQAEIKSNISQLTDEDWERESNFLKKIETNQSQNASDYEEYETTGRFLIGTTS